MRHGQQGVVVGERQGEGDAARAGEAADGLADGAAHATRGRPAWRRRRGRAPTTTGALRPPPPGIRVTSPALPVAPTAVNASASLRADGCASGRGDHLRPSCRGPGRGRRRGRRRRRRRAWCRRGRCVAVGVVRHGRTLFARRARRGRGTTHYGRPVTDATLKTTPLHARHVAAGAKTADFGGWDMPIEYDGRRGRAHRRPHGRRPVRRLAHGQGARPRPGRRRPSSTRVLANDLDRIGAGQAQYSMLCNDAGGVIDDLIVYRWADDEVFMIPNAANAADGRRGAAARGARPGSTVDDHHDDHGIIAVQGPRSAELRRAPWACRADHDYMAMASAEFGGAAASSCAAPGTRASTATSWSRRSPSSATCGTRCWRTGAASASCRPGSARATRCAPRWATRCTARTSARRSRPSRRMLGWAVGWDKPAVRGPRGARRAAGGRARRGGCAGCWRSTAASRARTWRCIATATASTGAVDRRGDERHLLADAASRASGSRCSTRRSASATRWSSTCAAGRRASASSSRRSWSPARAESRLLSLRLVRRGRSTVVV